MKIRTSDFNNDLKDFLKHSPTYKELFKKFKHEPEYLEYTDIEKKTANLIFKFCIEAAIINYEENGYLFRSIRDNKVPKLIKEFNSRNLINSLIKTGKINANYQQMKDRIYYLLVERNSSYSSELDLYGEVENWKNYLLFKKIDKNIPEKEVKKTAKVKI